MFQESIRKNRSVSLTPLIDVVFLLLIFFMLASTFLQTQALTVLTPGASTSEATSRDNVVEIWLRSDGTVEVDGKPVAPENMAAAIKSAVGTRTDIVASVLAEKGSKIQMLVNAVEASRDAGVKTVGTARVEKLDK